MGRHNSDDNDDDDEDEALGDLVGRSAVSAGGSEPRLPGRDAVGRLDGHQRLVPVHRLQLLRRGPVRIRLRRPDLGGVRLQRPVRTRRPGVCVSFFF